MDLESWARTAATHRRPTILLALLTTFAGVALLIDRPKGIVLEWIAAPLIAGGGSAFTLLLWPKSRLPTESELSLVSKALRRLSWNGRLIRLFPAFGVGLVLADLTFNMTLSASPSLQTEDTIVLLAGITFIAYGFVPARFARERDFALTFFICLNLILVVPLLVARLYFVDFERSVDVYSWAALAPQTGAVLSIIGVRNTVHTVVGSTAPGLTFTPQHLTQPVTLVITTACSGIYSFGIFASAFVAFVLTEYENVSRRVWLLLATGMLTAYTANVLRMVVIVLVGYYTDTAQTDLQNMLLAHSYAGWIIFVGWLSLFWSLLLRVLSPNQAKGEEKVDNETIHSKNGSCAGCRKALSPTVPAIRCLCGLYYHRACIELIERCEACGQTYRLEGPSRAGVRGT